MRADPARQGAAPPGDTPDPDGPEPPAVLARWGAAPARDTPDPDGPEPPAADRAAIAADALAKARADAIARGTRPPAATEEIFSNQRNSAKSPVVGASPRRQRREDPAPLDAAIGGLVAEVGWEVALTAGSLFGRWAQIVGPDLAAHTSPEHLADGELVVAADSTAWATQLRLLAGDLVRRLNAELGDGTVRRVNVRGPGGPAGRPGQWRVRGGRGPRDTYG